MISEFELLADKVERMAELAHAMRLENAQLRRDVAVLVNENKDLHMRMSHAHERVAALLAKLPGEDNIDKDAA